MAVVVAQNQDRVWRRAIAMIQTVTVNSTRKGIGAGTSGRAKRRIWQSAGAPSGAAVDGLTAGDLILDTTNDDVYRYITGTTYVNMTADS